jgi:hypothetical protein
MCSCIRCDRWTKSASIIVLLIVLVIVTGTIAPPRSLMAHPAPSQPQGTVPEDDVKDNVDVFVALRLVPTATIKPGETLIIEIYAENRGVDRSSEVLVDLFYEEYQLEIQDSRFERGGDHVSRLDYERPEITFDNLDGNERTMGQLITRVRPDLPPGSQIKVWAEWQWDYDEYNLWGEDVVERRFKEKTSIVTIPVVSPQPDTSEPMQPPEMVFVYNIAQPQDQQRCFPETGYCIGGRIREFWEWNGGLPVFGYPIGPERLEQVEGEEITVQWFERTRMELHPLNLPPYDVQLGRLGVEVLEQQGQHWKGFPQSAPHPECRYFPETGHNVCGAILERWRSHGLELDGIPGLSEAETIALFGLPISNLRIETLSDGTQYPVQWFERARFELHPRSPPPYNVMIGLLGKEMLLP